MKLGVVEVFLNNSNPTQQTGEGDQDQGGRGGGGSFGEDVGFVFIQQTLKKANTEQSRHFLLSQGM